MTPRSNLARRERMRLVLERDGVECVWCRRPIDVGLVEATTEHLVPRIKGGPSILENEVAACRRCNGARGHVTPAEWIVECRGRGWEPNVVAVLAALRRLQGVWIEHGGLRRVRPYVESQIRRIEKMT